ncbi:MAG: type II toxin-antitoxin system death-on-curing family toxin [Clostridia bacterium]|nr:type II toxin-antitoxin system death-on-curing family toxin [Clostridia bacterium]
MTTLSKAQVIALHDMLIRETGGTGGLRDEGLLESALYSPFQTFDGQYVYPSIEMKAARLAFSLVKNHPFVDGNKRIGILVMLTFLELNGIELRCDNDTLIDIGIKLAEGSLSDRELFRWIQSME